ncbi:MAG: hypothetical protein AAFV80_23485, partial [Bacteroidota bacterium]
MVTLVSMLFLGVVSQALFAQPPTKTHTNDQLYEIVFKEALNIIPAGKTPCDAAAKKLLKVMEKLNPKNTVLSPGIEGYFTAISDEVRKIEEKAKKANQPSPFKQGMSKTVEHKIFNVYPGSKHVH